MCQGIWSANMMQANNKYSNQTTRTITNVVPRTYDGSRNHPATAEIYTNDFLREPSKEYTAVFQDLQPLTFILKTSGLLPLYEQISAYELAPPSKTHGYYSLFIRGVVYALTILYMYNLFAPGADKVFYSYSGDTVNVNQYIEILLCVLTYTATVLITSKNAQQFLAILNEILKVDEEVRQKFAVTLRNRCGFVWKFMLGITGCQCYLLVLNVLQLPMPFDVRAGVLLGCYAAQNCLSAFFIVYTAALLRIVTCRFVYVNLLLTGYTYGQQRKLQQQRRLFVRRVATDASGTMEGFPDDSLFSYRMHNKLLRIYKAINDCCSLILVAYMGYAFYSITTNTYNLFVLITSGGWSLSVLQWGLAWLTLHISLLALLSRSCGDATKEANITSQILARIYDNSKECQSIIDKFLTKSIKQEVQFTAYGFFVIDNSTLFKIFSAVTTYLVILIQFRQLEDSKLEDQTPTNTN